MDRLILLRRPEQGLQLEHILRKPAGKSGPRRNASSVCWSVPGARPRPRSIRPGNSVANVPNCSAITNGAWFGNMIPPAPTRIVLVPPATWPMHTAVAALAMPARLWCSASQKRSKPAASACCARSRALAKASAGVKPSPMLARSSTESFTIAPR